MHTLFNLRPEVSSPVLYSQQWHNAQEGLAHNLRRTIGYYRISPAAVEAEHFLVRLIQSIAVSTNMPVDRYYDHVDNLSMGLSMALRMTSSIYRGRVFKGVFYGPNCKEILIADDEPFNPMKVANNWRNAMPIRVLRHPWSDLNMNLPDGKKNSSDEGLAVIVINIPKLAVMYKAWRDQEHLIASVTGEPNEHSIMQFIHMYVLPNMLVSQTDYTLFNRFRDLVTGAPYGESYRKHPFNLVDITRMTDRAYQSTLENVTKQPRTFTEILRGIPALTARNMDEVMKTPDLAETLQVRWALFVARLPAIDTLLEIQKRNGSGNNTAEYNKLRQIIRHFQSNNVMRLVLDKESYEWVKDEIDDILAKLA